MRIWVAAAMALVAGVCGPVLAGDLRLGLSSSPTSLDPQFHNLGANSNVAQNMFDTLVQMDPDSRIKPGLAESWRHVDDLTWEFTLRAGVTFHDGSPLTADDVAWSLERPASLVNSPAGYVIFTRAITSKQVVDARTIRLSTAKPYPLLLSDLSAVYIVSRKATEGVPTEAFATGKGVVGTGAYKFTFYARDDRVVMARNPAWWGGKSAWDTASVRFLPNNATRLAALLAGDLEAIEGVPTPDLEAVKANKALVFAQKKSHRMIYLYVDQRAETPFVTAKDGGKLAKNPLADMRVRRALSMAINREAIADRVLGGLGYPTNNLVAETLFGNDPTLGLMPYDPEGARKLLAEAGYADGFGITIHGPNNRFVNDAQVVQAIGQMLSRIGIATKVETLPMASYATNGAKSMYSLGLIGYGAQTGESSSTLRAIIMCERQESGGGLFNWSHYCNPKVDAFTEQALSTVDDAARLKLLQQAAHLAVDEGAIVPLYFQATTWAARQGMGVIPRTDERTFAEIFRPAP